MTITLEELKDALDKVLALGAKHDIISAKFDMIKYRIRRRPHEFATPIELAQLSWYLFWMKRLTAKISKITDKYDPKK